MFPKMNKGQSASTGLWHCGKCGQQIDSDYVHICPVDRAIQDTAVQNAYLSRIADALERIAELLEKQHKSNDIRIDYKPAEDASNTEI